MTKDEERFIMRLFIVLCVFMIAVFLIMASAHAYSEPINYNQTCLNDTEGGMLITSIYNGLNNDEQIINQTGCSYFTISGSKNLNFSAINIYNATNVYNNTNSYTTYITVSGNGTNQTVNIQNQQNLSCNQDNLTDTFAAQTKDIIATIQTELSGQANFQALYTTAESQKNDYYSQLQAITFNQTLAYKDFEIVKTKYDSCEIERSSMSTAMLVALAFLLIMLWYVAGGNFNRVWKKQPKIPAQEGILQ